MSKKLALVDEISERLCDKFQLAVPLHPEKLKRSKNISKTDIKVSSDAALKTFYQLADEERVRHGLGIVGRARVAFGLQQRLLRAGYAAPLVKQVLFAMLASAFAGRRN